MSPSPLSFPSIGSLPSLFVLLAFLAGPAAAGVMPAPQTAAQARGADGLLVVPPVARITDPEHYLAPADRSQLEAKLAGFEAAHGTQIVIVLVASTLPEPIEDFAHRVGDAWKIGRKGIGDGVLIVVAVRDRAARIDVARSLEGAIPDVIAFRVIREQMGPRFAAQNYAGGLSATLDALFALVQGENLPAGPGRSDARRGAPDAGEETLRNLVPFIIGGLLLGAFLRRILGIFGALIAAGGTVALVIALMSSVALGVLAGVAVFVLSIFGAPMMILTQVLGGRSGGFPGGGFGGGFSSGGGGDFSGGGASGKW